VDVRRAFLLRLLSASFAICFVCCLHARLNPLGDERRFELGHRADDREHGFPDLAVGVDWLSVSMLSHALTKRMPR
jgi:hypothetical protein